MRRTLLLALCAATLAACVASPRELPGRMESVTRRGEVPGSSLGVTLLADAAPGAAVMVTVINRGERPLRLQHGDFSLAPRGELASNEPTTIGAVTAMPPRGPQALPEGTLAPGETARGLVFFPERPGGPAQVQIRLVDAGSGAVLDIVATGLPAAR